LRFHLLLPILSLVSFIFFAISEAIDMGKLKIQNTIKLCRFMKNEMTQQELADLTGVTRQTIAAIEKGKYFPTLLLAFQIAHVFGKPLEEVFKFEPGSVEEKEQEQGQG
jgi:putative transcriptional regulator